MPEQMRFDGKVAFVTGGASGLGAAAANRFASEGAKVVLADIDEEGARRVANALPDALAVAVMRGHGLTLLASHDADFDRVPGITRYAPA